MFVCYSLLERPLLLKVRFMWKRREHELSCTKSHFTNHYSSLSSKAGRKAMFVVVVVLLVSFFVGFYLLDSAVQFVPQLQVAD